MGARDSLKSASANVSYNVLIQVVSRALTFLLNAFTIRFVSGETLGVVNVRLALLHSTLVSLSRDAFRKAGASAATATNRDWRRLINALWLPLPLGVLWASLLTFVWLYLLEAPDPVAVPNYGPAVALFALAGVQELLVEPLRVLAQVHAFARLKAAAESLAVLAKCVLTAFLVVSTPGWGLYVFAAAQLAYAGVLVLCYLTYFAWFLNATDDDERKRFPVPSVAELLPHGGGGRGEAPAVDRATAALAWSFFKQSFLKQALTEGERYLMTFLGALSFAEQGVYDAVDGLGSAAARFIFAPLEESFYVFFARVLERERAVARQKQDEVAVAAEVLERLLRLVLVIGLAAPTFGYAYARPALHLYGSRLLSGGQGPALLRWYSVYVLLLAVNGVTECFVSAAMSREEVERSNPVMLGLSASFLTLSYVLSRLTGGGGVGFVLANCLNMALRIVLSLVYIRRYFRGSRWNPLRGLRPRPALVLALGASAVVTAASERLFCGDGDDCYGDAGGWAFRLAHATVGAGCLAGVLLTVLLTEHKLVRFVRTHLLSQPPKKDE